MRLARGRPESATRRRNPWTAFRTESFDKSYEFFTDYGGQAKPKKDGQGRTLRDPDGDIIYEREQWRPLPDVEGEQQIGRRP